MERYIDVEKFLKSMIEKYKCIPLVGITKYIYGEESFEGEHLDALIKAQPTADVAEVVRCSECKKWKINPNNLYGGYCRHCEGASIDHFCSYGERK